MMKVYEVDCYENDNESTRLFWKFETLRKFLANHEYETIKRIEYKADEVTGRILGKYEFVEIDDEETDSMENLANQEKEYYELHLWNYTEDVYYYEDEEKALASEKLKEPCEAYDLIKHTLVFKEDGEVAVNSIPLLVNQLIENEHVR